MIAYLGIVRIMCIQLLQQFRRCCFSEPFGRNFIRFHIFYSAPCTNDALINRHTDRNFLLWRTSVRSLNLFGKSCFDIGCHLVSSIIKRLELNGGPRNKKVHIIRHKKRNIKRNREKYSNYNKAIAINLAAMQYISI